MRPRYIDYLRRLLESGEYKNFADLVNGLSQSEVQGSIQWMISEITAGRTLAALMRSRTARRYEWEPGWWDYTRPFID